jgi:Bacterial SH3 domain
MVKKKYLLRLSVALLTFNVLIGGLAIFNDWKTNSELAKANSDFGNGSGVLGVNTDTPKFDRNYVISNQTFSSTSVFPTESSVQEYLTRINSPLKSYVADGKPASYWIFGAARGSTSSKYGVVPNINPALILTFLEKEQSLLSLKSYDPYKDSDKRIKYAMGYGCPDDSACDATYNGFVNQVNWAAYQLQFNYNNSVSGRYVLPYKVNNTITTLDEYNVFLTNEATAAIYRYTPHVYWGAYNTWKIIVANGWGQIPTTYNMGDIDRVNLVGKDAAVSIADQPNVSLSQVSELLKKGCRLGDSSENVKLMQRFLRQQGYFMNREITGVCGTVTKRAIEVYFGRAGELLDRPVVISNKSVYASSKGVNAKGLNSRIQPCGTLSNTKPIIWGTKGTIVDGPVTKACLGGNWNWYNVRWEDGTNGWSVSSFLNESPATTVRTETSKTTTNTTNTPGVTGGRVVRTDSLGTRVSGLNLRSSACGTKTATIPWGTKGTVIGSTVTKNCLGGNIQWTNVRFDNGRTGWVAGNYLK